jgi:hypothetical protein
VCRFAKERAEGVGAVLELVTGLLPVRTLGPGVALCIEPGERLGDLADIFCGKKEVDQLPLRVCSRKLQLPAAPSRVGNAQAEGDRLPTVGGKHGLAPRRGQVADGRAPKAQRNTRVGIHPGLPIVRPAGRHRVGHAPDRALGFGGRQRSAQVQESR